MREIGHFISNAQVALAWILAQPGVTAPIIGATRMAHLDDALAALASAAVGGQLGRRQRDVGRRGGLRR